MLITDSTEKEKVKGNTLSYSIICCTRKPTLFVVDLTHAPYFRPYFYKKVTIQVF